jgi:integral membrane protein
MQKENLEKFRKVGIIEGISYLVLLFIAMPLKYWFDMPMATKIIGSAHGVLFIAYCYFLYVSAKEYKFSFMFQITLFIASLIPFATFITDKKLKEYNS